MKHSTDQSKLEATVLRCLELVAQGEKCLVEAGELLVQQLDAGVDVFGWLAKKPERRNDMKLLRMIENIGRKRLHPLLLRSSGRPWVELARKLSLADQIRLLEEKVELVIETTEGTDVLLVDADALNREQAHQILHGERINSPAEQKVWLAARKMAKEAGSAKPWRMLKNGKFKVFNSILDPREVLEMAQEIKSRGRA